MKNYLSFILAACMLCTACDKRDDNEYSAGNSEATANAEILKVSGISPALVPADTTSTSSISLQLTKDAAATNRTISLTTDLGQFLNGQKSATVIADANGLCSFFIKSSEPGTATVTATIKGISVTGRVVFQPAFAEDILCIAEPSVLDTSQSTSITVTLVRNPGHGIVSNPQKVNFSISGTGAEQLTLPDFAFSSSGVASVSLSNPLKATGTFIVTAKTQNTIGETLSKSVTIIIR